MNLIKKIFALLITGFIFTACAGAAANMIFDATNVKVGDKIGEMTVKSVEAPENSYPEWTPKNDEVAVYFEGQVAVTGNYDNVATNEIRFYPDAESLKKLPKLNLDTDQSYFVLSDTENNQNAFSPVGSKGAATLTIGNYIVWSVKDLGIKNTADIVSVENKK